MLADTAFLDDAQVLGGVPCEPASSEPCWVNMSTLSSATSGSSSSSNSSSGGGSNNNNNNGSSSSNASAAIGKKRRKSDTKPLSQLNKCLNEKRRREQENVYIEELAELISASIADMNSLSVKPDKCAILQETVNQIRRIKEQEDLERSNHGDDVVQQGEVSSSKPALLDTQVLGTFLLEALDGFLFVVNTEGKIEYVSENVTNFLQYTADDLVCKSIYNIIHLGDHARFSSSLLPTSIGWPGEVSAQARSRCFNCRLLVKPPDDQEETMEEKQQRVSQYENMQISAVPQPYPGEKSESGDGSSSGEGQHCLVCVARRFPAAEKQQGPTVEQFTTKLDLSGKILAVDTNGVSPAYSHFLNKDLVGCVIRDLCHPADINKLTIHLKEALTAGTSTSSIYRLRVGSASEREKASPSALFNYVFVQTKSKRFPFNPLTQEAEFLMATHSVIADNELALLDCDLGSSGLAKSAGPAVGPSTNGNPVLTSVVRNDLLTTPAAPLAGMGDSVGFGSFSSFPLTSNDLSINEFTLDLFPTSTWGPIPTDADDPLSSAVSDPADTQSSGTASHGAGPGSTVSDPLLASQSAPSAGSLGDWGSPPARPASNSGGQVTLSSVANLGLLSSRPNSRQSAASTPRPPSVSAFSPAPNSVLGLHSVVSPLTGNPGSVGVAAPLQQHPSPASMTLPYSSNFPFSPLQDPPHLGGNTPTTNPGTPLFEEPRDSKEGILQLGLGGNNSGESSKDANSMLNTLLNTDASSVESGRLRVLLMQRSASSQANGGGSQNSLLSLGLNDEAENRGGAGGGGLLIKREKSGQDNRILKNLLDQDEDDDTVASVERLLGGSSGRPGNSLQLGDQSTKAPPSSSASSASGGNEMLHTLLNQRNDDDDLESRVGLRKPNELLKQLLKDPDDEDQAQHKRGEQLLKSLGFSSPQTPNLTMNYAVGKSPAAGVSSLESMLDFGSAAPSQRGTKRPSEEAREDVKPSKQASLTLGVKKPLEATTPTAAGSSGTSSGSGGVLQQLLGPVNNASNACAVGGGPGPPGGPSLCEKNKMLASLLAKTPLQPSLPVSTASPKPSALPQEKLPRDLKEKILQTPANPPGPGGSHWTGGSLQQQQQQQQQQLQQQQNAFNVQPNLMQPRQQLQQQQVPRSHTLQQPQQQQQLMQPPTQQQQQQLPSQTGSFLNSLLVRSVEAAGPAVRNSSANDQQQQHFLQHQKPQQQHNNAPLLSSVQLRPHPSGILNQNQVSVSAALSTGGGFSISLNDSNVNLSHTRTLMSSTNAMDNSGSMAGPQNRPFPSAAAAAADPDFPADWGMQGADPLLSDILDQAIEMNPHYEPAAASTVNDDFFTAIVEQLISSSNAVESAVLAPPPVTDINEKLAINAIQKSLMSFETVTSPSIPTYNVHYGSSGPQGGVNMTQQQQQQTPNQLGINPSALNNNQGMLANQQAVQRRHKVLLQQQQRRLVGRQVQSVNMGDHNIQNQGGAPSTFQPMDDLLNGVPPNMTITRSGAIPESQSSPGYGNRLLNSPLNSTGGASQISPGLRNSSMQPPFSPHGQVSSSFGNSGGSGGFATGNQARLSPHGNLPPYSGSQVSPRVQQQQQQPQFSSAQLSPQSANVGMAARASPGMNQPSAVVNWNSPVQPPQQQQQQPPQQLLSQMANYPAGSRGYGAMVRAPMRSLPSPGPQNPNAAGPIRPGTFTTTPEGVGPNPQQGGGGMFVQQPQQHPPVRLQRSISTSSALTGAVLADGANLTRHLGPGRRHLPVRSPPSALIHHPATQTQYQHSLPLTLRGSATQLGYVAHVRYPAGHAIATNDLNLFTSHSASLDDPTYFSFDSVNDPTTPGPPLPPPSTELHQTAGSGMSNSNPPGSAMSSEFVRKELRAVVGARTSHNSGPPLGSVGMNMNLPGHGLGGGGSSQAPLIPGGQSLNQADLESLGLSLELPQGGSDSGKSIWDSPSIGEQHSQRQNKTSNEETSRSSGPNMSLLQKLLSE